MLSDESAPASPDKKKIVCPRYELIYEYIRITDRPLTNLEQRAFLHMLDLDADDRFAHSENLEEHECICMDILPAIVQALEPDPVEHIVAERTLENETCPSQRFHTEKIKRFQGITLGLKTQKEHTKDLRKLVRKQLIDVEKVLRELLNRPFPEYENKKAMIEKEFPAIVELAGMISGRRKREAKEGVPGLTWANVRQHLEENYFRELAQLQELERTLAKWGVG